MKLSQLKSIIKEAVKESIQEEMKEILLEAVRSPKHQVFENATPVPQYKQPLPGPLNPTHKPPYLKLTS